MAKAAAAFKDFSASRHTETTRSARYVQPGASPREAHRAIMSARLKALNEQEAPNRQLNLALTPALVKQLMPSLVTGRGSVSVANVLSVLTQYSRGTSFFVQGHNTTLRRLALQSEVEQIMKLIQGAAK